MIPVKNINIICGHYGSGKTNFVLNLALDLSAKGKRVTVVDLDIVNPYFRSGNYSEILEKNGIKLIATQFANSNLDLPSLPAEIQSVFSGKDNDNIIIIDVGGDDAGAVALGRFSAMIRQCDYQVFYLVNRFRALTQTPQEAAQILREIETACRLNADSIINNSHLGKYTSEKDVLAGYEFAQQTASLLRLSLTATTCTKDLESKLSNKISNLYTVDVIVKPPF